ncbi:hypothetical protein HaLaN_15364, partial [Haematococcus lacustris]
MGCSCSKDQAALVADPVTTAAAAKANAPDEQPLDVPPRTTTSAADSLPEEVLLSGQSATSKFEKMAEPKKGLLKSTSYVGTQ